MGGSVNTGSERSSKSGVSAPLRLIVLAGLLFADAAAVARLQEKSDQPQPKPGEPGGAPAAPQPATTGATGATGAPVNIPAIRPRPATTDRTARPARTAPAQGTSTQPATPASGVTKAQPVPPNPAAAMQPNMPSPAAPATAPAPAGQPQPAGGGAGGVGGAPVNVVPPPAPGAGEVGGQLNDTSLKIGPFAEPVQVKLLVDLVAAALNIQVMDTGLALADKKVSLLTQIEIPRAQLIDFLNLMLEQNGQMMMRDVTGIYMIRPNTELVGGIGRDQFSTTRLIPTPGIRPSSLQQAINIGIRPSGNPASGAANAPMQIAYMDDLGMLLVTDTPARLKRLELLVDALVLEQKSMTWQRFPLRYLASNIARQRVLEILGLAQQRTAAPAAPGAVDPNTGQPIGAGGAQVVVGAGLSNLATRLTIDPQSNDLLLRGTPSEVDLVRNALQIVDVPSRLVGKWYGLGGAAQTVAEQLKSQGLGQIITLQNTQAIIGGAGQPQPQLDPRLFGQQSDTLTGGSRFVIDPMNKGFMYYGTQEQHQRVSELLPEFDPLLMSDEVIYEFYSLKNSKAEVVAEIIRGLITNQVPVGDGGSALLPGGGRAAANQRGARPPRFFRDEQLATAQANEQAMANALAGLANETSAIEASDDVFVLPYKETNTIVVKAPRRLQRQFAALIDRLDIRRPQVYIDAKMVIVTGSDDMRLAVETQIVNAAGTGGVLRTIFPPSPTGVSTSGNIIIPPIVNPLTGMTAAIIGSDYVPIVITAIANETNARIFASPRVLVDDNEEATISSKEERPTQTQTQTNSDQVLTGFGGYEEAGPELKVTPQISSGDYVRLEYSLNLSAFIGEPSGNLPPPKQSNDIVAKVTVPTDSTIIVGGLTFDQERKTVVKVPLLGDIPIVGILFRDERTSKSTSTIYVFITPRIMRDTNFEDVRLLSKGPMSAARIDDELPEPELQRMEIVPPSVTLPPPPPPPPSPQSQPIGSAPQPLVPITIRREDE